jgi:site-specific DNA recombinase
MNAQSPNVALRAALYLRVSTARQAEHDVSIPDQRKQGEAWCAARGYQLVEIFVEPGNTATNDRRPEFQRMIEAGTSKPAPFDVVLVHSFSRFFRDAFDMEYYYRKLAKNDVRLISITQELGDDPIHDMMRRIMSLFDEYQSKENGKHVTRALKENARQGFWNGALPPIGYRIAAAEQRGAKTKKKLEIDPLHAGTIRLIYRLALEGQGDSGQMGVKAIVKHLNAKGIFTRDGGRWGIGQVHRVLTRRTYIGEHEWGKRSKHNDPRAPSEVVIVPVPAIIERETFDAVQSLLQARNPKTELPARVVIGPTLLTGICYCGNCGGAMTIRTGKSGRYRYYACSIKARQGETGCKGRAIPMDKLDTMVASHIEERLLDPDRLEKLLGSILGRREDQAERRREHIASLQRQAAESESRLKRLYDAIEAGVADLDDPALKERIAGLKVLRDQARVDADRAQALLESPGHSALSPAMIAGFARRARERIRGHEGGYRRDHLRALAQRVEVADDAIRIMGSKTELLKTLIAGQGRQSAAIGVPRSGLKWRSGRDSNPRYAFDVYSLSRRAPSTTRPPLRIAGGSALALIAGVRPVLNANAASLDLSKRGMPSSVRCDMSRTLWQESRNEVWPVDRSSRDGGGLHGGNIRAGHGRTSFTPCRDTAHCARDVGPGNAGGRGARARRAVSAEDGRGWAHRRPLGLQHFFGALCAERHRVYGPSAGDRHQDGVPRCDHGAGGGLPRRDRNSDHGVGGHGQQADRDEQRRPHAPLHRSRSMGERHRRKRVRREQHPVDARSLTHRHALRNGATARACDGWTGRGDPRRR